MITIQQNRTPAERADIAKTQVVITGVAAITTCVALMALRAIRCNAESDTRMPYLCTSEGPYESLLPVAWFASALLFSAARDYLGYNG